jgi:hypothetical protein
MQRYADQVPIAYAVDLTSHDRRITLHPVDFDPEGMVLAPGQRRPVQIAFDVAESFDRDRDADASFEISQLLDGEVVGGVSGVVTRARREPLPSFLIERVRRLLRPPTRWRPRRRRGRHW